MEHIVDPMKLSNAMDVVRNIRNELKGQTLSSSAQKFVSMFIDIAFNPSTIGYVCTLIGMDAVDKILEAKNYEEMEQSIRGSGLFSKEVMTAYTMLSEMIRIYMYNEDDVDTFIRECVISFRDKMGKKGSEIKVICLRYGVEI